jgi:iron(III) transport system permease protein
MARNVRRVGHDGVKIVTDKSLDDRALHFSSIASRLRRLDASILVWLALVALLAFLVLNPILRLIISSLQETDTGRLTFANYRVAYGNVRHLQALANSLELGMGVALLATCFGVPIAWAISRTDMPGKAFVRLMVFAAFVTPPILVPSDGFLAGPNSGWLNKVWMALTGSEHGIFNIYSMTGLILVVAVKSLPWTPGSIETFLQTRNPKTERTRSFLRRIE